MNIEGIRYAKSESRSETFADDTTIFIKRTESNLRNCLRYLKLFAKTSGLQCNIGKTKVIPVGDFTVGGVCDDQQLVWDTSFTILGVKIDNHLEQLNDNFAVIYRRVSVLINKWKCYGLTIPGREVITKSILLSQYTYVGSMLDMTESQLTKVQTQLNQFVLENSDSSGTGDKKNWMKEDLLYGKTKQGGRNLINVRNYFKGLKLSWLRRYAILKYDDHWCDLLDQTLGITSYDQRKNIFNWGSDFFF